MVSGGGSLQDDESALWGDVQSKPVHQANAQQWDGDPLQNPVPVKPCSEQDEVLSL